jgi:hypothetical protein
MSVQIVPYLLSNEIILSKYSKYTMQGSGAIQRITELY